MTALEQNEEAAEKAADERRQLDDAWKELAQSVLSSVRIDPKWKQLGFFLPYKEEVTLEQVKALQASSYGRAFMHFLQIWKHLPEKGKPELYEVAELFKSLSVVTGSPYREIKNLEKDKDAQLEPLDILRKMTFLPIYSWSEYQQFHVDDLAEQLNTYIRFGIEWIDLERTLLKLCVLRAADEYESKSKPLSEIVSRTLMKKSVTLGTVTMVVMVLTGFLLPILFWLAIDAWIAVWSFNHLSGVNSSIWAIVGLVWLLITIPGAIIYYGTTEIRHSLRKLINPGWDWYKPAMSADLRSLSNSVNSYRAAHTNLRLAREQLARLQNTEIKLPVQLLTLIDRAIAKGQHHW